MSEDAWYYAPHGQQAGPVSRQQVLNFIQGGTLKPDDLVWREGMQDWQPIANVPELSTPARQYHPAASPPPAYPQQPRPTPLPYQRVPLQYQPVTELPSHKGLAIASFVLSLCGFVICGLIGIVGIILAIVALNGMKQSGNPDGRGFAIAGLAIGLVQIGLLALALAVFVLLGLAI